MLHLVATPIGNLDDLSPRAREILTRATVIACEDTRRTWALLSHCGIARPSVMLSYREQNEQRQCERLMGYLEAGQEVALCTDGGYPGISDPGYRILRSATQAGIAVSVIPGAGAVSTALLLSGLSTSSYTFKGFPPRKRGALLRFFEDERDRPHTLVCFESPHRIGKCLAAALEALGDREAAVCIEMTKRHERVSRGYLSTLAEQFASTPVKGEVTLVIAGDNPKFRRDHDDS